MGVLGGMSFQVGDLPRVWRGELSGVVEWSFTLRRVRLVMDPCESVVVKSRKDVGVSHDIPRS